MDEVVIIGAGPAGMAAAAAAAKAGARVTVLDAYDNTGGQIWRHPPGAALRIRGHAAPHGWRAHDALRAALEDAPNCTVVTSAHVWSIERDDAGIAVNALIGEADGSNRKPAVFRPSRLVLATGAFDRVLPFPGWELPGVVTGGAAQALLKSDSVRIGDRVVVGGSGPFLLPVARSLVAAGSDVVSVVESSRVRRAAGGWLGDLASIPAVLRKAPELGVYTLALGRHRIPYRFGTMVTAAYGAARVEEVEISTVSAGGRRVDGTQRRIAVDAVCVTNAFTPRLELALAAGCRLTADRYVAVDRDQRTSVDGVFAAGEITSIGGADLALAEGEIAGHVAAGGNVLDPVLAAARSRRASLSRFARRMSEAHPVPSQWPLSLPDDTIVCRCEEVTHGELCGVMDSTESRGLRSLKLSSRVGLGICQARVCGRNVEDILRSRGALLDTGADTDTDTDDGHSASTDRRPIALPIRLGELAARVLPP